jgi:hypothetical protein
LLLQEVARLCSMHSPSLSAAQQVLAGAPPDIRLAYFYDSNQLGGVRPYRRVLLLEIGHRQTR